MKSFDFNRFWQTFRWVLGVNRHTLTLWTVGSAVGIFLMEMVLISMGNYDDYSFPLSSIAQFSTFLVYVAFLVGFSSITAGINRKASRESLLMLPATNAEKFLSLLLYVTVVWTVCIFAAFAAGDTLRMAVRAWFWKNAWLSTVPHVLDNMAPMSHLWLPELVFTVIVFLWVHSFYILGGTLLRKYAFVIVSMVIVAIPIVANGLCIHLGVHNLSLFIWHDGTGHYVNPITYVLDVVFLLLAVFNYWASYHIFKNIELITNQWTNYDILKR